MSCWDEGRERTGRRREGGGWMRNEEGEVGMSNGEGWDDRRRAHSDGASAEWELRDKTDTAHIIAHPRSLWNGLNWQLQVGFAQG